MRRVYLTLCVCVSDRVRVCVRVSVRACVRATVIPGKRGGDGGLKKHEWLFHGWLEMPCPRQSRPRRERGRKGREVRISPFVSPGIGGGGCCHVNWKEVSGP